MKRLVINVFGVLALAAGCTDLRDGIPTAPEAVVIEEAAADPAAALALVPEVKSGSSSSVCGAYEAELADTGTKIEAGSRAELLALASRAEALRVIIQDACN